MGLSCVLCVTAHSKTIPTLSRRHLSLYKFKSMGETHPPSLPHETMAQFGGLYEDQTPKLIGHLLLYQHFYQQALGSALLSTWNLHIIFQKHIAFQIHCLQVLYT